jgi:hypothetical protein
MVHEVHGGNAAQARDEGSPVDFHADLPESGERIGSSRAAINQICRKSVQAYTLII